ncbi:MAG: uncharacterized protein V7641_3214 [Blastocatellia bacterium]
MRFEGDANKAAANLAKHGVSFEEAQEVFDDEDALVSYDAFHSEDEERFFIIGFSSRRLLYVVYAECEDDVIRLISARRAVREEQKDYERAND